MALFCRSLSSVVANALVSRWFVRRIGLAMDLTAFGVGLSGAILPPIIGAAMPTVGWRGIFRAGSLVIAFIVVPLILIALRDRPTSVEGSYYLADQGHGHRPRGHGHFGGVSLGWRMVITRKNLAVASPVFVDHGRLRRQHLKSCANRRVSRVRSVLRGWPAVAEAEKTCLVLVDLLLGAAP